EWIVEAEDRRLRGDRKSCRVGTFNVHVGESAGVDIRAGQRAKRIGKLHSNHALECVLRRQADASARARTKIAKDSARMNTVNQSREIEIADGLISGAVHALQAQ